MALALAPVAAPAPALALPAALAPVATPAVVVALAVAVAVVALFAALFVARRWVWRLTAPLGDLLGWLAGTVFGIRRRHVVDSLRAADIADAERVAGAMYSSLGRGLCELGALAVAPSRAIARMRLDAQEVDRAVAAGRGAVIATAHTGNWDLLGCAAAARWPLTIVTKRLSVGFLDRLWQGLRRRRGVTLVSAGGAARAARCALGRGELVAMMIDQAPERERGAIHAVFMGRAAWVDLAPALVAMRARVPLIVVFPHRCPDGTHAAGVAGVIEPPPRSDRAWAEAAMRQATAWLEAHVRQYPAQWLWMHRRWKDVPAAQAPRREAVLASGSR